MASVPTRVAAAQPCRDLLASAASLLPPPGGMGASAPMCAAARPRRAVRHAWVSHAAPRRSPRPGFAAASRWWPRRVGHVRASAPDMASNSCYFWCPCAQLAASAPLCIVLLAAMAAPTRAELAPSEFRRVLAKFRAEAQGVSEASNHHPTFLRACGERVFRHGTHTV